ncbi:MAG: hypothetical protein AB1610_04935, partial [Nitrospirota bacterium]
RVLRTLNNEANEDYLQQIANVDPKSGEGIDSCLWSIHIFYLMTSYTGVATPTAINDIRQSVEATREIAFRILPPFLESPSEDVRCNTAMSLAYYGWKDSYPYVMACGETFTDIERKATVLAILGDKRAATWIIDNYKKRYIEENKSSAWGSDPGKWILINALYPFATPEILPFINQIISDNARNYDVKARAKNVRNRIYELYPETKKAAEAKIKK